MKIEHSHINSKILPFSNDNDVPLYVDISDRNYHTCVTHTMV